MTKRPSYHDLLRNDGIPPPSFVPTKPRPKAKAKSKLPKLTYWGFSSTTPHGVIFLRTFVTREAAMLAHVRSEGPIVRIQVPMPAQKGTK